LNRIDEIMVFQQLTKEEIRRIVDLMSADLQSRIKSQGMELVITDDCKDMLAKDGYNPAYGARPLRRSIQRFLEDALAEQVLQGLFKEGDTIITVLDGENVKFEKGEKKASPPTPVAAAAPAGKAEKAEKAEKPEKGEGKSEAKAEKEEKPEPSAG
jgi:ATP-dependent Clp protease ATP-binding subunit ClpC